MSTGMTNMPFPARQSESGWDYRVVCIHARHNQGLEEGLKQYASEGWELFWMHLPIANEYQCVFRRQAN